MTEIRNGNDANSPVLYQFTWEPLEEKVFIKDEFYPNGSLKSSTYYFHRDSIKIINSSGEFDETYVWQEDTLIGFINTDGQKRFVLTDHVGSVTVVMDDQGNVIENTFYSPYGEILEGGKESRYTFIGKEYDTITKEYDLGARRYKPEYGIFTQPDRSDYDMTLPKNLRQMNYYDSKRINNYIYGNSNPYRFTDTDGLNAKATVNSKSKTITISTKIYVYGKSATKETAKRMQENINKAWNKNSPTYSKNGVTYNVKFNVQVLAKSSSPLIVGKYNNAISVPGNTQRSFVNSNGKTGEWRSNRPDPAPHEFGHLVGLDDRYTGNTPDEGWEGNIMAEPAMEGTVEQRNIDTIVGSSVASHESRGFSWFNQETSHLIAPSETGFN